MTLADYDALSFDCYGTLVDWEAGIAAVLTAWSAEQGLEADAETLLAAYAEQESPVQAEDPGLLYPDVLARAFVRTGERLGATVSPQWAARLGSSVPDWPAFPDSPSALAALAEHYRLIIVSNVDRSSFAGSNARLGVTFDAIITAQDVGSYKPAPGHFDALLRTRDELGIAPGRLLHVAQSLFHDHVPARRYGLPTVWIDRRRGRDGWGATPRPEADVEPDWQFGSMAELAAAAQAARA